VAGSCERCNEPSGSIKSMEFLDYLSDFSRTTLFNVIIKRIEVLPLISVLLN